MDFKFSFRNEFDRARRIDPSDLEQSKFRVILVLIILIGTAFSWVTAVIPHDRALNASVIGTVYLVVSGVIWLFHRANLSRNSRLSVRCLSLAADVTAASVFIAHTGQLSVFILPVSITIIIGYGFRFGLLYSLAALAATIAGMALAVRANAFLAQQSMLSASLFVSVIYAPIYSYYLLEKYRALLGHRNQLLKERESLMETIAHEFRSPLHALIFLIESAKDHNARRGDCTTGEPSATLDDVLQKASLTSERMVSLADRLLEVLVDRSVSKTEPINLLGTLRDTFEICRIHARRRGIRFYWNVGHGIPAYANIDRSILQDVLINVIDNSIKHTAGTNVVCEASIVCGHALRVYVCDSPPGEQRDLGLGEGRDNSEVLRSSGGAGRSIIKRQLKQLGGALEEARTEASWRTTLTIPIEEAHIELSGARGLSIALHIGSIPLAPSNVEFLMKEGVLCRFLPSCNDPNIDRIASRVDLVLLDEATAQSAVERLSDLSNRAHLPVIAQLSAAESLASTLSFPVNAVVRRGSLLDMARVAALVRKGQIDLDDKGRQVLNGLSGLLVDDSDVARLAIGDFLRKKGARLRVADSLPEAKRQSETGADLDFALLDVQIGDESGLELAGYLRQCYGAGIVVILLTGFLNSELLVAAKNAGADEVLLKSCSGGRLVTTVLTALKEREGRKQPVSHETAQDSLVKPSCHESISTPERSKIYSEFMQKLAGGVYAADRGSEKEAVKSLHQVDGINQVCGLPTDVAQVVKEVKDAIGNGQRVSDRILRDANRELIRFLGGLA